MAASIPGQYNTYVGSAEATQNMVADFSRNVKSFALPNYVQYVKVKENKGFYTRMTLEQQARLSTTDGADLAWADGTPMPRGAGNLESFQFLPYMTERFAIPFEVGQIAVEQASWKLLAQLSRIAAQRAMTLRTVKALSVLTTTGNYDSSHVIDVSSPPSDLTLAGALDEATSSNLDLKRTLDYAWLQVNKDTNGAIDTRDVVLVMNPVTAMKLSNTQELRDTVKQTPFAMNLITKQLGPDQQFGLPTDLYGYSIVVEQTVRVTTLKGATTSRSHVLADGTILMLSRPGGLDGLDGAPSFSTATLFLKEDMTVETMHDTNNRMHTGRVVDDYDVRMTAPVSGVIITNALAS